MLPDQQLWQAEQNLVGMHASLQPVASPQAASALTNAVAAVSPEKAAALSGTTPALAQTAQRSTAMMQNNSNQIAAGNSASTNSNLKVGGS